MIISQALNMTASKNMSRPAYAYLGKETNYGELKTKISRLSYLYMNELGHGQRVAFLTRNSPAAIISFFALSNTRSLVIPVNPDAPPEEILDWLKRSRATHVAVTSDLVVKTRELLQTIKLSLPIIDIEKKQGGEYDTAFSPPPDNIPADTDAILLLKTAGPPGKSKFAVFNHKHLQHAATCIRGTYHLLPTDRMYTKLNWSHPFAFMHGMLLPLLNGSACIIDHGLENAEMLDFIVKSRVTRLVGTPPFYLRLLLTCKSEKKFMLPGMKSITVGLGPLSQDLRKAFGALKVAVSQVYGQTEACWTITMEDTAPTGASAPEKMFMGKGLPGLKYKVVDREGDEIPGKGRREGLLAVTGPNVMTAYLDMDKETKNALRGTWLYTGDYARLEGEGDSFRLTLLGRRDEVILKEKSILTADEIDGIVKQIAGVQDAAGFPLQTTKGDMVFAVAVVKGQGSTINERHIIEQCKTQLPIEKCPVVAVFTDMIPRDLGGNVQRIRLRGQFSGTAG